MNSQLSALNSPVPTAIDPELSYLGRFLAWLNPAAPAPSVAIAAAVQVRIGDNRRGGLSLFPVNVAARELMGEGETGNFATPADARKRAAWNCWEVVGESSSPGCREPGFKSLGEVTVSPTVQGLTGSLPCLKTVPFTDAARGGEAVSSPTGALS